MVMPQCHLTQGSLSHGHFVFEMHTTLIVCHANDDIWLHVCCLCVLSVCVVCVCCLCVCVYVCGCVCVCVCTRILLYAHAHTCTHTLTRLFGEGRSNNGIAIPFNDLTGGMDDTLVINSS